MTAVSRQWLLHIGIACVAAIVGSLAHSTQDGTGITQHELLIAAQTGFAYLMGAIMKAPRDARDADAQTRASDTSIRP